MKATLTRLGLAAGLLTMLVLVGSHPAAAQQSRSLRIVDGEVYIDDRQVARDDLPAGLQLDGLTVHYTFTGDVRPVVQLGEQFYVLDGNRLRVAEQTERRPSPFPQGPAHLRDFVPPDVRVEFRQPPDAPTPPRGSDAFVPPRASDPPAMAPSDPPAMAPSDPPAMAPSDPPGMAPSGPPVPPLAAEFDRKAAVLFEQARRLEQLQSDLQSRFGQQQLRFRTQQLQEVEQLVQEMSRHAVEAAQMASDLPRLEMENYLQDVRRRNEGLFDRLVSERQLEHETLEMARRIRGMTMGEDRRGQIGTLRSRLDEIFDLKQENRRHEIGQLERRLQDLEQRLAERERLREEIVERRLRELLGEVE